MAIMIAKTPARRRQFWNGSFIAKIMIVLIKNPNMFPMSPFADQNPSMHPSRFGRNYVCTIESKVGQEADWNHPNPAKLK